MNVFGHITSGRGVASKAALKNQTHLDELSAIAGSPVFPGTLNILLSKPVKIARHRAINLPTGRRFICPAMLNGTPVFIHRWPFKPLHLAEVFATVGLRSTLGLQDGDQVTLSIDDLDTDAVPIIPRLVWSAIWKGRQNRYYTCDRYGRTKQVARVQRLTQACQWP